LLELVNLFIALYKSQYFTKTYYLLSNMNPYDFYYLDGFLKFSPFSPNHANLDMISSPRFRSPQSFVFDPGGVTELISVARISGTITLTSAMPLMFVCSSCSLLNFSVNSPSLFSIPVEILQWVWCEWLVCYCFKR
jgi:hypothetical protein